MPTVTLRGSKNGHKVARLVLEGSSSNPIRYGDLNGAPFEVTDEEFAKLDQRYVLEAADKPVDTEQPPQPEAEVVEDDDDDNKDDEK